MGFLAQLEQRQSPAPERRYSMADVANKFFDGQGAKTMAGTTIDETTALNLSAVWAAVRVLTDTVASIPVHVYRRMEPRGKERASNHPLYRLLHDRANPEMSAFTFKEVLQGHLALWGNGYAEKERNGRGDVVALWPITPNRVTPKWGGAPGKLVKVFEVNVGGTRKVMGADQIMHIPGYGFDGLQGYSPVTLARESLGLTKAAEAFGAQLFGQGLRVGGVLTHPSKLSDIARENLKRSIEAANAGLGNAHRAMLLEEGLTWTQNTIPPEDAQFLESRQFQTSEIARWFKVPPHMIGDLTRATNNNIEHQSLEFVRDTARPWFARWEQVLNWELFNDDDRGTYFAEYLMDALLRGDNASRGAFYSQRFNIGSISQNEIRELENQNPIEGGDRYWVQGALVPIDRIDDVMDAKKTAPVVAAVEPEPDPTARLHPVLLDAAERVLRREIDELRKAIKRGGVEVWADGFYFADHAGFATKRFMPACLAIDAVGGAQRAAQMGAEWATSSLAELRKALRTDEDVEVVAKRWEDERARKWVQSIVAMAEGG